MNKAAQILQDVQHGGGWGSLRSDQGGGGHHAFMLYCGWQAKYGRLLAKARIQGGKDADMLQLLFADRNQVKLACSFMRCYSIERECAKPMSGKGIMQGGCVSFWGRIFGKKQQTWGGGYV